MTRPFHVVFDVETEHRVEARSAEEAADQATEFMLRHFGPRNPRFKRVETTADDGGVDEVVL